MKPKGIYVISSLVCISFQNHGLEKARSCFSKTLALGVFGFQICLWHQIGDHVFWGLMVLGWHRLVEPKTLHLSKGSHNGDKFLHVKYCTYHSYNRKQ
jgi:hypothetical protein